MSNKISRRQYLKILALGAGSITLPSCLIACGQKEPLLRIASNVWPGYELIYMAKGLGYFDADTIRLVEVPSATVCIQSLAAGTIEGAMLTLDEVLTARAEGIDLRVIAVLDMSLGADVLLAQPEITSLAQLKGKTIGVEESAVGAIMLDAALKQTNLDFNEVNTKHLTVNRHYDAFINKEVDAVISFEPVKTQLQEIGAQLLFDSSQIPGRIIDVLVATPDAIQRSPRGLKTIVGAHFKALEYMHNKPQQAAKIIAKRLRISADKVPASYEGIALPDLQENIALLAGEHPTLLNSAETLSRVMHEAGLLPRSAELDGLIDARFLPKNK